MDSPWAFFENLPPGFLPDTMLLLTDGSVLVHHAFGKEWYRLTPDDQGQYDTKDPSRWSGPFPMKNSRQFFASGILPDGGVFVIGGEDSDDFVSIRPDGFVGTDGGFTPLGELFNPGDNSWSELKKPPEFNWILGDVPGCVLANGSVLLGSVSSNRTAIWNPKPSKDPKFGWKEAGLNGGRSANPNKFRQSADEETWTLLPDGAVLTIQIAAPSAAEKYLPDTDRWVSADQVPATLTAQMALISLIDTTVTPQSSVSVGEIGPAIVLPDGRLFAIGGTGHTALYNPPLSSSEPGSWTVGPDLPPDTSDNKFNSVNGNIQTAIDAPAVLLPNGKVLCATGNTIREIIPVDGKDTVSFWSGPTNVLLYDPTEKIETKALLPIDAPNNLPEGNDTSVDRLLLLPNGQVLFSCESNFLAILTVDPALGAPAEAWKPSITGFPSTMTAGLDFTITGTQFNGLSQACSYGDDAQCATNYPIFRLTDSTTNRVQYLRSSNFSTKGIATKTLPVSATVTVPAEIPSGQYALQVIANGIPSDPVIVNVT